MTGSTPSVGTGFIQLKLLDLPFELPEDEPPTTDAAGGAAAIDPSATAGTDGAETADVSIDDNTDKNADNNAGEGTDTGADQTVDGGVEPGEPAADEEPLQ